MKKALLLGFLLGCWPCLPLGAEEERPILVLASIKPLALIAEAVVENTSTKVDTLLPVGVSLHDYTLKPSDARRLQEAGLLLWLGPQAEPHLAKVRTKNSLPLLEGLPSTRLIHRGHGEDQHHGHDYTVDPHIWLDPGLAREVARRLAESLISSRPSERQQLQANLSAFESRTKKLEEIMRMRLIPLQNKAFLVHHDAYQYLIRPYGIKARGVILQDPGEAGLSVKHLLELQESVRGYRQICIFSEPQFEGSGQPQLGAQVKVLQGVLDPLGSGADSYESLMMDLVLGLERCLTDLP